MFGVVAGELGWIVLRDEEENPHRVKLAVGWLALCQLDRRDAQGPDVGLQKFRVLLISDSFICSNQFWRLAVHRECVYDFSIHIGIALEL